MKRFSSLLFAITIALLVTALVDPTIGFSFGAGIYAYSVYCPTPSGVLGLNTTNNVSARQSYDIARRMFFNAFRDKFKTDQDCQNFVNSLKLSPGEIRLELNLSTTANQFSFGVTPTQASSTNVLFPTEQRLPLQDSICVNEYGIFVAQAGSNTDTTFKLHTYGNTQDFAAADAAALDSTFYSNGGFNVKVNNDVLIPYRGLYNHYYAPQTQQTAPIGAGSPKDQLRGAEDGFVTSEPNLVIIGSKNYVPQIVLPGALASAAANLRCVLIMRGIYAQNSTVVS
jgi:hypothetical protein